MTKHIRATLIISAAILILPFITLAHNPRLVESAGTVQVQNPEISQAFYGQLNGSYQDFRIDSASPFNLYANILVPDLPMVKINMSIEIFKLEPATTSLAFLEGARFTWMQFYEPFAGDKYFKGPEFSQEVGAGKYLVRVSSPNFKGKYVLAIGQKEAFLSEAWDTLMVLPTIKNAFFNKSPWTMFFNYIGLFLLAAILILAAIAYFAWRWIIKHKGKKA